METGFVIAKTLSVIESTIDAIVTRGSDHSRQSIYKALPEKYCPSFTMIQKLDSD
jgi:DNA-binding phage protein